MNEVARLSQKSTWSFLPSFGDVLRSVVSKARSFVSTAGIYAAEHHKARQAEETYDRLWWMSDEELKKRGLTREQIAYAVKERIA